MHAPAHMMPASGAPKQFNHIANLICTHINIDELFTQRHQTATKSLSDESCLQFQVSQRRKNPAATDAPTKNVWIKSKHRRIFSPTCNKQSTAFSRIRWATNSKTVSHRSSSGQTRYLLLLRSNIKHSQHAQRGKWWQAIGDDTIAMEWLHTRPSCCIQDFAYLTTLHKKLLSMKLKNIVWENNFGWKYCNSNKNHPKSKNRAKNCSLQLLLSDYWSTITVTQA